MFEPAIVMTGIGLGAAGVLAVAARVFHVDIDPRIAQVEDVLPGANCGGCGFSGCGACAEAMVAGKTSVDACIAAVMLTSSSGADVPKATIVNPTTRAGTRSATVRSGERSDVLDSPHSPPTRAHP